jgi:hypothetical protein
MIYTQQAAAREPVVVGRLGHTDPARKVAAAARAVHAGGRRNSTFDSSL